MGLFSSAKGLGNVRRAEEQDVRTAPKDWYFLPVILISLAVLKAFTLKLKILLNN